MIVLSLKALSLPSGINVVVALLHGWNYSLCSDISDFVAVGSIHFLAGCWTETALTSLLYGPLYTVAHNMEAGFFEASKGESPSIMDIPILSKLITYT